MLERLYIRNYTLIDELDVSFQPGFSVITGETGAGKSIILGAVSMILGQRADTKFIKTGEKKCIIEAQFRINNHILDDFFVENDIDPDETCILRREILDTGKSRAFINDTPASLTQLKALGEKLIDVHSQHQNLLLQKDDFQMNVVDIVAGNQTLLHEYHDAYQQYNAARKDYAMLCEEIARNKDNEDFLRFQHTELEQLNPTSGMQEELEQEQELLTHAGDIKEALSQADLLLNGDEDGVLTRLKQISRLTSPLSSLIPTLSDRIESARIEIQDIAEEISSKAANADIDPARLQMVSDQLDMIYKLERKHNVSTVEELIEIKDKIEEQLLHIDDSDLAVEEMKRKVDVLLNKCTTLASQLSKSRQQAAKTVEKELSSRLVPLGIPNIKFQVAVDSIKDDSGNLRLSAMGADKVQFLFSANKNVPLRPLTEVASGGEIARVMLSVKAMISGMVKLPTIIFDEIDTGISGKIAQQMAVIMQQMGNNERQVITITHLPQIAAAGSTHYKVYKEDRDDRTTSVMKMLSDDERVGEIAQMLSGDNISNAAIVNAKELLKSN